VPSEMFGGETPVLSAFLAIHSRATRMLSSVPALSLNTDTEKPPSDVRTSEKLTNPFTARNQPFNFAFILFKNIQ
jgi:hypothetical protein